MNKNSSEYVSLLNLSDAVHSIRSLYTGLSSYQDRGVFRTTFKMEHFAKRIMTECKQATRNFAGQGRFRGAKALR